MPARRWLAVMLLAALPVGAEAQERCETVAGRVVALEDVVEVARGAGGWRALDEGDTVCAGEVLRAGDAGQGAVLLESGTVLRLNRGTTLRIEPSAGDGRTVLNLLSGLISLFNRRPHALEVDTAFANAAVEGTEFTVEATADRSHVVVLEGRVRVSNPQGAVQLAAGQAAVAVQGRAPELEIAVRPRDAVRWALYYPPIGTQELAADAPAGLQEAARLAGTGERAAALTALEQVPTPARDGSWQALRAELLLGLGRPQEADQALAAAADDPDALALRAVMAVARNEKEPALAAARRAVELAPRNARAHLALSYAAQASFDIPLARQALEAAVQASPNAALVWARLAEVELMQGDVRAAKRAAERATALDPANARAQSVAGYVALARLDTRTARAAFARAIDRDPFAALPRLGQGLATIRDGDLAAGRQMLELAVALDPSDPLLRSYLGKAYFEEGSYRIASDELATAKELDPNDPTPWLYDAITKQLTNRPIEGLRDLEKATELNDNRAVYRSRLLLDQDRGTRSVGLGRVYQDLGFEQLGINEASRSLLLDNANAGAHRFLADLYSQQPRSELAYFSERLQTLLLQPPSRTPVSPRLALSDLSEIARPGFGAGSFNEFSSLFDRNGIAFSGNGRVGSNETRNGEAIVSALADNVALSAGVLKSENDGFRDNDELRLEVADVFGQVALSPELSLQAEYRARELDRGSLAFDIDPDRRDETEKANVNQEAARVGLHYAPAPGHDLLVSAAYGDRNTEDSFEIPFIVPIEIETPTDEQGRQLEVQHRWQMPGLGIIAGVGDYDFDLEQSDVPDDYRQRFGYVRTNLQLLPSLTAILGVGIDDYRDTQLDIDKTEIDPLAGLVFQPLDDLTLRAGYSEQRKQRLVANESHRADRDRRPEPALRRPERHPVPPLRPGPRRPPAPRRCRPRRPLWRARGQAAEPRPAVPGNGPLDRRAVHGGRRHARGPRGGLPLCTPLQADRRRQRAQLRDHSVRELLRSCPGPRHLGAAVRHPLFRPFGFPCGRPV